MSKQLKVMGAQLNLMVGDLKGNLKAILASLKTAEAEGVDLLVLPELALTGYPPEDLLFAEGFVKDQLEALHTLARATSSTAVVLGFADPVTPMFSGDSLPRQLANAAALLQHGTIQGVVHKTLLPNYGVFDEERYFAPRSAPLEVFTVNGVKLGIAICEDLWQPGVADGLKEIGAELLAVVNASPYHRGKPAERFELVTGTAKRTGIPAIYVNLVGGQDQVVFDGGSLIVDGHGELLGRSPLWKEDHLSATILIGESSNSASGVIAPWPGSIEEEVYGALVTGLGDYVHKNNFKNVVLGLSGGIDSALIAAIAADALGADAVRGIGMPGPYSSEGSVSDARSLAKRLGIKFDVVSIRAAFEAYQVALAGVVTGTPGDVTEQNVQARIRGGILMGISNQSGAMVMTTGNKSEIAVGYCTLYGDMCGGFAAISDVPKTLVYDLCRWRNANGWEGKGFDVIPAETIEKPPSAELAPDQQDTDNLPPYEILDPLLEMYIEGGASIPTIVKTLGEEISKVGDPHQIVSRIVRLVDINEYKRRQAAPGIKITGRAFGRDRRLPITSAWRGVGSFADDATETPVASTREAVDAELGRRYTPEGVKQWWERPRTTFEGRTPAEVFDANPGKVFELAEKSRGRAFIRA